MLTSWLQYPGEPDQNAVLFIGIGGAFTAFLMIMQRNFIWWPFHVGGYALGASWGMIHVWTSIIVGWALKGVILKYGGGGGRGEGVWGGCSFFHWTYSGRSSYWLFMVNTWRGAWNTNIRRISLILSSG